VLGGRLPTGPPRDVTLRFDVWGVCCAQFVAQDRGARSRRPGGGRSQRHCFYFALPTRALADTIVPDFPLANESFNLPIQQRPVTAGRGLRPRL